MRYFNYEFIVMVGLQIDRIISIRNYNCDSVQNVSYIVRPTFVENQHYSKI